MINKHSKKLRVKNPKSSKTKIYLFFFLEKVFNFFVKYSIIYIDKYLEN